MTWAIEKAALVALGLPRLVCAADGRLYQHPEEERRSQRGDGDDDDGHDLTEPAWPRLYVVVVDALFGFIYLFVFLVFLGFPYHSYQNARLEDYAALSAFVMSNLHLAAFKKGVKARCQSSLVKKLEETSCRRCGQVNPVVFRQKENDEAVNNSSVFGIRKEISGIPGWAKAFNERRTRALRGHRDDLEAGPSNDEDENESLVVAPTPESSKGYGTLSQSVHSLSGKAEGVVKKKGLKRVVGEAWIDSSKASHQKEKGKARVEEESDDGA